jgi:hypothetical protein
MFYLSCAEIQIPLCYISAVSWSKTARTVQHSGGYISARGFEAAEISVRAVIDYQTGAPFGLSFVDAVSMMNAVKTERTAQSGVFYIAGFSIYPELEFALTNINKTWVYDATGTPVSIEADMVFSGVRAVKEVVRNRALEIDSIVTMPDVFLSVGAKRLKIQDSFQLVEFVTNPDSISLGLSIGSDMDLVNRQGFLADLLNGGRIIADLPQGETVYYIIDANLVEETLGLTGSIYPPKAMQTLTRTYSDTTLKAVVTDLAKEAGIECECLTDGKIDYYMAFNTPIDCLKEIQTGAGFIMSCRNGKLTCAGVPGTISGTKDISYIELTQDSDREKVSGLYWYDGINCFTDGKIDSTSVRVYSRFRSSQNYASECLRFARYSRNQIVVMSDIDRSIDSHSVVTVRSNDAVVDCLVDWFTFDWIGDVMTLELHYLG